MNWISYFFWQTNNEAHRAERLTQLPGVFLAKVLNSYFLSLMLYNVSNNDGRCPAKLNTFERCNHKWKQVNFILNRIIKIVYFFIQILWLELWSLRSQGMMWTLGLLSPIPFFWTLTLKGSLEYTALEGGCPWPALWTLKREHGTRWLSAPQTPSNRVTQIWPCLWRMWMIMLPFSHRTFTRYVRRDYRFRMNIDRKSTFL